MSKRELDIFEGVVLVPTIRHVFFCFFFFFGEGGHAHVNDGAGWQGKARQRPKVDVNGGKEGERGRNGGKGNLRFRSIASSRQLGNHQVD